MVTMTGKKGTRKKGTRERSIWLLVSAFLLAGIVIIIFSKPSTMPAENGLVAYWKLDEGSGTTVSDDSGNGNTGTIYGASWVDGKISKALSFNGTDTYVEIPYSPSLDFDVLTWAAWVKADNTNDPIGIVGKASTIDYAGEWATYIGGTPPRAKFITLTSLGRTTLYGDTVLSEGAWYHLAGTYDGSVMKVYVNGVEDGSANQSGPLRLNMSMLIGRGGVTFYFNGIIDDVRVYNMVLSASEIQGLATAQF